MLFRAPSSATARSQVFSGPGQVPVHVCDHRCCEFDSLGLLRCLYHFVCGIVRVLYAGLRYHLCNCRVTWGLQTLETLACSAASHRLLLSRRRRPALAPCRSRALGASAALRSRSQPHLPLVPVWGPLQASLPQHRYRNLLDLEQHGTSATVLQLLTVCLRPDKVPSDIGKQHGLLKSGMMPGSRERGVCIQGNSFSHGPLNPAATQSLGGPTKSKDPFADLASLGSAF